MELLIEHDTTYRYEEPQRYSIQYLRLTPLQMPHQTVWRWSVQSAAKLLQFRDGFGNVVDVLTLTRPHQEFTVSVRGHVSTADTGGVLPPGHETLPPVVYVRATELTAPDAAMRKFCASFQLHDRDELQSLAEGVAHHLELRPSESYSGATAAEIFAARVGACQDHAHVFVACCRMLGVPARYVSGYYRAEPGVAGGEAGYAWAEAYLPGTGWVGLDVARGAVVSENYIRIACGLDHLGAAPVRSVRRGPGPEHRSERVSVAAAAQGDQ